MTAPLVAVSVGHATTVVTANGMTPVTLAWGDSIDLHDENGRLVITVKCQPPIRTRHRPLLGRLSLFVARRFS